MKRKATLGYKAVFFLAVLLLLSISLTGLFLVRTYTGYLGLSLNASAGTISTVLITYTAATTYWSGAGGLFSLNLNSDLPAITINATKSNITMRNMTFDCFGGTGNDIYFSTTWHENISYPVVAATIADVISYIGTLDTSLSAPNNTLTRNITVNFGGTSITTVGTYTKQKNQPESTDFDLFVLKDNLGRLLWGTHVNALATGFNGQLFNYQVMLPIPANATIVQYYAYGDPLSDPFGNCTVVKNVVVDGYVLDNQTGLPLENVSVKVGGAWSSITNSAGFYSLIAQEGTHFLIGEASGYLDYIDSVTLTFGTPLHYNFSMIPTLGQEPPSGYGFIRGVVRDNDTQLPIQNVSIQVGGLTQVTDANGNYTIVAPNGNNTLVALRTGYNTHVDSVTVTTLQYTTHNINLTRLPTEAGLNGTLTGFVKDTSGVAIGNVSVYVNDIIGSTNTVGNYSLSLSTGSYS